jgi:integrating conjugative element protein (TIGR03761 family)
MTVKKEISRTQTSNFPVVNNSPFPDGYDIDAERKNLADLIAQDNIDPSHPQYLRLIELESREEQLRMAQRAHSVRNGADKEVADREAMNLRDMGRLQDEAVDSMQIHTLQAARLFIGKAVEPGVKGYGMAGGKKVGASLRQIWHLSANDNPYADFALIQATERMRELRQLMETDNKVMLERLNSLQTRGLKFSVLTNPKPYDVNLGFKSPYGYSVIILINEFDYFVRLVKSLVSKDLISDDDGRQKIYDMTRKCRSIFEEVVYFQRYLTRDVMLELCRGDFLPGASEDAKKRVQAANGIFGELPREVFNGTIQPRHSRRKVEISPEELRLLNEVPLAGEALPATTELV